MAEKYTAEQVIEAAKGSGGLVSAVARRLGCNRRTVYRYRDRYVSVKRALEDEREQTLDLAEAGLLALIRSPQHPGHTTALIFYLKTIGKGRGYVERVQVEQIVAEELGWMIDRFEQRMSPEAFREAMAALAEDPIKGEVFR